MTEEQPPADKANPPERPYSKRLTFAATVFAFLASYIISAGPVVFITKRIDLPLLTSIMERIYAPIILIVKLRIPLLSPAIEAWVRLFR